MSTWRPSAAVLAEIQRLNPGGIVPYSAPSGPAPLLDPEGRGALGKAAKPTGKAGPGPRGTYGGPNRFGQGGGRRTKHRRKRTTRKRGRTLVRRSPPQLR